MGIPLLLLLRCSPLSTAFAVGLIAQPPGFSGQHYWGMKDGIST